MTTETEIHEAINAYIAKNNYFPDDIVAGYYAALTMSNFCSYSYNINEDRAALLTPFGWLPIIPRMDGDSEHWELR